MHWKNKEYWEEEWKVFYEQPIYKGTALMKLRIVNRSKDRPFGLIEKRIFYRQSELDGFKHGKLIGLTDSDFDLLLKEKDLILELLKQKNYNA